MIGGNLEDKIAQSVILILPLFDANRACGLFLIRSSPAPAVLFIVFALHVQARHGSIRSQASPLDDVSVLGHYNAIVFTGTPRISKYAS
jgi:hypothetical protein